VARSVRETFRVPADLDLEAIDPRERPVGPKYRSAAAEDMVEIAARLDALQEALYAEATAGGQRALLLVLQGMDTSGKSGVIRHVAGVINPNGLQIASFKKPTEEELAHHFLWRVRAKVPVPGRVGVFDRSHYEDVLVVRVESLVPENVWRGRYGEIRDFEAELTERGVAVVKCMLHISPEEQADRLLSRLDDPTKRWKYNPGDVDVRQKWHAYMEAYADALRETDSDIAPWYVVPADRRWYRNWVVAGLLAETLAELDPRYPQPDLDLDAERARIKAATV
jgi:PPK2 family polyphosphate:nucleotide phosphotransferase